MQPQGRQLGGTSAKANKTWAKPSNTGVRPNYPPSEGFGDGYYSDAGADSHYDYTNDGQSDKSSQQPVLFVGSLPPESTPQELQSYFTSIGAKVTVKIIVDWITHRSKQCALVFCDSFATGEWLLAMNHQFHGKALRLDWADNEKRGTKKIETNILFVGNISEHSSEEAIKNYFSKFGIVANIKCFSNKSTAPNCKNAFVKFTEGRAIELALASRHNHRIEGKHVKVAQFKPNTKAYHMDTESTNSKTKGSRNSGKEHSQGSESSKPASLMSGSKQNSRLKSSNFQQGLRPQDGFMSLQTRSEPIQAQDLPSNFSMQPPTKPLGSKHRVQTPVENSESNHLYDQETYDSQMQYSQDLQGGFLRQTSLPLEVPTDYGMNGYVKRQSSFTNHSDQDWSQGGQFYSEFESRPMYQEQPEFGEQLGGWNMGGGLSSANMMLAPAQGADSGFSLSSEHLRFGKSARLELPDQPNQLAFQLERELDEMALSQNSGLGQMIHLEDIWAEVPFSVQDLPYQEAIVEESQQAPEPDHVVPMEPNPTELDLEALMEVANSVPKPFCPFLCKHSHICISDMYSSDIFKLFCPSNTKSK